MDIVSLLSAGLVVVVLAVLYLGWRIYHTGEQPESLGEWAVQVEAAEQWALLAVEAAQQLWESDQIDKGHRYDHADLFLKETLPNLNSDQRRMLVESAVFVLKRMRETGMWHTVGRSQTGPGEGN